MIFLDGTVVNTALPAIARDFGANNSVLQWVVNMYSLILAGLLLVGGSLGDRFGRRRALAGGMVVFGLGAVG
ncbi:MAG: MFS transporter, partial [Chloroflexi bacterium]|nr:MFS transporter [Chloroflexota bacterium]